MPVRFRLWRRRGSVPMWRRLVRQGAVVAKRDRNRHVAIAWLFSVLVFAMAPPATEAQSRNTIAPAPVSLRGAEAVTHLKQQGTYDSLAAAVTKARYRINRVAPLNGESTYEALNPAEHSRASFTGAGVHVAGRNWQVGFELTSYGYGDDVRSVTSGEMTVRDNRIEINKHVDGRLGSPALVEWYVNTPQGLEQGFTLPAPPGSGRTVRADVSRWLRLNLRLSGDLQGEMSPDGQALHLKDQSGRHAVTYDHLRAWDATGHDLAARMHVSRREVVLEVDDRNATYPIVVDPLVWEHRKTLTGELIAREDAGFSVAVSGTTAIVGDFHETLATDGKVFVFVRKGAATPTEQSTWVLQATLEGDDQRSAHFGRAVAISGNTAIIGDPLARHPDADPVNAPGAAYIYLNNGGSWELHKRIFAAAANEQLVRLFGSAVAISGDTAIIGAPGSGLFFHELHQGAAFEFTRDGGWTQKSLFLADDRKREDEFGTSVAISGDTVIIGAPYHDVVSFGETHVDEGQAYAFVRTGDGWSEPAHLTGSIGAAGNHFGISVAVSGVFAVVGTYLPETSTIDGLAYVYRRIGLAWNELQVLAANDTAAGNTFGYAVAMSGDTVVVGASSTDIATKDRQGAAYVFKREGPFENPSWKQHQKLIASAGQAGDVFGYSVAISGGTIIVGAPGHDVDGRANQGHAYVYEALDSDGDGLPDDWEKNGVTIDGEFIDLKAMGANPLHKDVFVHVDWMGPDPSRPGVLIYPDPRAIKQVIDAFAAAPVDNLDHKRGISIHIDVGDQEGIMDPVRRKKWGNFTKAGEVPFSEFLGSRLLDGDDLTEESYDWGDVDAMKDAYFNPAKRNGVFHYAVFANALGGFPNSGVSRSRAGTDFVVTLGKGLTPGGTTIEQAGTFMHELGHNLGLPHGGSDTINKKPNYLSIMNYRFQKAGLLSPTGKQRRLDYSRAALPPLDETSLKEADGIMDPTKRLTTWNDLTNPNTATNACLNHPKTYNKVFLPAPALDWNCDGAVSPTPVVEDINGDGICVEQGDDDMLSTIAAGDDEITDIAISAGPDRQCDTLVAAGDKQKQKVGYIQPDVLTGFNDWPALVFGGGGGIGALGAEEAPPTTPVDEASIEELDALVQEGLLEEEALAPLDVVTASVQEGPAALLVDFDGSASTAPAGMIVEWAWDFGDGTTGSGATIQHVYDAPGEYFASLTVTDDQGRVNLVPLLTFITVTDAPPPTSTPVRTSTATPQLTPTRTVTATPPASATPSHTGATPPHTPTPQPTSTTMQTPNPQATATPAGGLGDVDLSFRATVTRILSPRVYAVVTQPDQKIIVGGEFESFAGCARRNIARINADGSCDTTFDPGLGLTIVYQNFIGQIVAGTHRVDLPAKALALQADGKILVGVAGHSGFRNGVRTSSEILVRLNADGSLDSSFDARTLNAGNGFSSVLAIAIQPDGQILVGGAFLYDNGKIRFGSSYKDGQIARLNPNGSLDPSFVVPDGSSYGGPNSGVNAIALQTDGKIVIGGSFREVGFTPRHALARLNADGSVDPGYNAEDPSTGRSASGISFASIVFGLAVQSDGKVLVAGGLLSVDFNQNASLIRVDAAGSRDASFTDWRASSGAIVALALQTDQKVVVGGDFRITTPALRGSLARLNADGSLDLTFDTPGARIDFTPLHSSRNVFAITLHAAGKIVVAGTFDNFDELTAEGIVQLDPDGSRDPSFDSNGGGENNHVFALIRQPDGKLLVGFGADSRPAHLNSARRGGIGRLNVDGTTDAAFTSPFDYDSTVYGIALQPDGKVLVGGGVRLLGSSTTLGLARLHADGTLDAGFVLPEGGGEYGNRAAFALQADGKILANEVNIFGQRRLVRLNTDGSLDDAFAVPLSGGLTEHIVVQPDGKILVAGLVPGSNGLFARLHRLNADGSLDPAFNPGAGPDENVRAMILQPDGKILIGGWFLNYDGTPRNNVARINADGSVDASFVPSHPYSNYQRIVALALQPDGKVFIGVDFGGNGDGGSVNRVVRLDVNGNVDSSFPQNGTGIELIPGGELSQAKVHALLLQPDGSLIVGGDFDVVNGTARLSLARLLGPPSSAALDHFLLYKTKPSKGTAKFAPLGPVTLADAVATADVDVRKIVAFGLPANVNGAGVEDEVTHLTAYALRNRKSREEFRPIPDVRVENACGELVVTIKKPDDLLVPTHLNPADPALPPAAAAHRVDDFRCYRVTTQKKRADGTAGAAFPRGVQIDAADTIQSRRYDLKKLTRVCFPVTESGTPVILKTGEPFSFTPAALRHESVRLACYQAKPAKRKIEQNGCGPSTPKEKGVKIIPVPLKHAKQLGLRVISQFGTGALDTAQELEVCVPSTVSRL